MSPPSRTARLAGVLATVVAVLLLTGTAEARTLGRGASGADVQALTTRLAELGYLPAGSAGRTFTEGTEHAVYAFQKWQRLSRDGRVGPQTKAALATAKRPAAPAGGASRRVDVLLDRQVALLIRNHRVERVISVSTGAAGYRTPAGTYKVFRKEQQSWSHPYKVWLPYASYFVGGIAFHGYASVPAYAASHGCVRVPLAFMREVYAFATMGTQVRVRATAATAAASSTMAPAGPAGP